MWFWRKPKIIWHLPKGRDDLAPQRKTKGSLAYDLISPGHVIIPRYDPKLGVGSALVDTFVAVTLPRNYGLKFASRSGLADKGIIVQAGVIDSDYRGFLMVLLFNFRGEDYEIEAGSRIAQARIVKMHKLRDKISYTYPDPNETVRGAGGFGSTGR